MRCGRGGRGLRPCTGGGTHGASSSSGGRPRSNRRRKKIRRGEGMGRRRRRRRTTIRKREAIVGEPKGKNLAVGASSAAIPPTGAQNTYLYFRKTCCGFGFLRFVCRKWQDTLAARRLEEPRNSQELLTESVDLTKFVGPLVTSTVSIPIPRGLDCTLVSHTIVPKLTEKLL